MPTEHTEDSVSAAYQETRQDLALLCDTLRLLLVAQAAMPAVSLSPAGLAGACRVLERARFILAA